MSKKEKVVVIFIEGETEIEFYKRLVSTMCAYCGGHLSCSVKIINVAGIGQYKSKVLRIFEKQIKRDYPKGGVLYSTVLRSGCIRDE